MILVMTSVVVVLIADLILRVVVMMGYDDVAVGDG